MQSLKTPNVYRQEKDQSEVTAPAGTSVGAIVGSFRQGEANQRILVTFDKDLVDRFGIPIPDGEDVAVYAGMEFLKESDSLYVVRATSGSEQYANAVVSATGRANASNGVQILAAKTATLLAQTGYADGNKYNDNYDINNVAPVNGALVIACKGPGLYGNDIGVTVVTSACAGSAANISGAVDWSGKYDASISGSVFKISVFVKETGSSFSSTSQAEEVFYVSRSYMKDGEGKQLYVEDVINGISKYIYVSDLASPLGSGLVAGELFISGGATNGITPVALSGGRNSNDTTFTANNSQIDAWDLFYDRTKVSVNILMDTLKNQNGASCVAISDLAASRLDCDACVQAGGVSAMTVELVKAASDSLVASLPSYVAVYAGFDKIYDSFNDRNVFIPKCVYGAVLRARTDRVANTWDAPAGMNRGILPSIGQNVIFSDTEIGLLYDSNINTSRFIRGVGNVMWGQKTWQKKKSALDRINVRRLLLYIENSIEPSLLPFLFEPNNSKVRLRAWGMVDGFMRGVLAGGGVTKYEVVCDETNNTSQTIDNNELILDVYVQPTKTIEYIRLNIVITRTGVNFAEIR